MSRPEVGSSRIDDARLQQEDARERHAPQLAAGEFVRIAAAPRSGSRPTADSIAAHPLAPLGRDRRRRGSAGLLPACGRCSTTDRAPRRHPGGRTGSPLRARRAASGARPLTDWPSSRISPALSRCRPRMVRPSVVLPQPDSPTSDRISPSLQVEADAAHRLHRRHRLAQEALAGRRAARTTSRSLRIGGAFMRIARSALRRRCPPGPAAAGAALQTARDVGAARREPAAGRRRERRRHRARNADERGRAVGMAGEQRARVGMRRRVEDRQHRARLDRLAGIDDAEIVAQLGDDAEIVGHEQQRDAELAHQLAQQQQDLVLGRDVERRGRLVGDHQARRAGERRGDQQALALAAGELVRIALERRLGIGHLHAPQQPDQAARHGASPLAAAAAVIRRVPAHDLQQLRADLEHGIERQQRILRNEADAAARARRRSARFSLKTSRFSPSNQISPLSTARALGQDAHDGADQRGLAAARFAHHAQDAAALERRARHRRARCAMPSSVRIDTLRPRTSSRASSATHRERRRRGSTRSRSPSPSRLKPMHRDQDGEAREGRVPPGARQVGAALGDGEAPVGRRRRRAHAEEAQHGGDQDGEAQADGGAHDHRRERVGQDVQEDDARRRRRRRRAARRRTARTRAAASRHRRCG